MSGSSLRSDVAVLRLQLQNAEEKLARQQRVAKEETELLQRKVESEREETERVRSELQELKLQQVRGRSLKEDAGEGGAAVQERDRLLREKQAQQEKIAEQQRLITAMQMQLDEIQRREDGIGGNRDHAVHPVMTESADVGL